MDRKVLVILIALIAVLGVVWAIVVFGNPQESEDKIYVGNSLEECATIRFMCEPGREYFQDEKGCGCQVVSAFPDENLTRTYCTPQGREAEVCTAIYEPVCGWNNQSIQCVTYPCAQTYGNSCTACINPQVEYWTPGECPSGN